MALQLTRRTGQKIILSIDPTVDPQEALRWILEEGIEIGVAHIGPNQVFLDIRAPLEVKVRRKELVERDNAKLELCSQ
jgi:hypothetical protein